ncbi:MAG: RagB/SusD family nutrient uptake outer membrane protein [Williamsia sp.]|nr:RagB/SusD family nutrient uptake outer membrane protein [Williamsia sp.]
MRTNHSRTIIFSLVAGVCSFAVSCKKDDALNPLPTTLISDASAFTTTARISNQVNGLYATFKGGGLWGSNYLLYSDARAGDFISTNQNPLQGGLTYALLADPSTTDVSVVWQQSYQLINGCNVFLAGMQGGGATVAGDSLNKNWTGEARTLRAIAYYSLLQLYAQPYRVNNGASPGVPLRLTANTGLSDYNLARSSVDAVYKQILADLNYAETNVPLKYSTAVLNTTRIHRNTVVALKTRVYLSMGDYANVITEANKIVPASAPFTAAASGGVANALQADITTVFKTYTTAESIFSMPFTANDAPGNSLATNYLPVAADATGLGSTGSGQFYLFEKGVISDPGWKATDRRRALIFATPSGTNTGRKWNSKFATGSPYTDYIPVIRYAEVMLSLAEALANANGIDARATALLNAVRQRSDATTTFAPTSKADLIDKIINERRIEFLGEGLRNADLMRLGLPIPAKTPTGSTPVPASNPGDNNYTWPVPNSETLYNKLI